jgi:hypothetical protein
MCKASINIQTRDGFVHLICYTQPDTTTDNRDFNKGRHPAICRRFKRVKSPAVLSVIRAARSLVFFVCPFVLYPLAIVLSVFRYIASDYAFGMFILVLHCTSDDYVRFVPYQHI